MIGLVIITQGRLAIELRATLEHVLGRQAQLELVSIDGKPDIARDRAQLRAAVGRVDTGDGVIIVTDDMFGAPASELAIPLVTGGKLDAVDGANLPVLIKLATLRRGRCSVAEAVSLAQESGRKHIRHYPESAARMS